MKQEIIDKILTTNLVEEVKSEIINSLTERHLIEPFKGEINMGESKIGGFPHLPKYFEYPQDELFFYEFVGQINLAQLSDCNIPDFPKEGIIYFFIDDDFNVSNINTKVFVLAPNIDDLEIKRPPLNKKSRCESFSGRTEKTEMKLKITKSYTIEQKLLDNIVNQIAGNEISVNDFDIDDFGTRDQIWGFTTTWGGVDGDWSAYLAKRRLSSLYWLTLDYEIDRLKKENIDIKQWLHEQINEAINKHNEILNKYDKSLTIYPYWEREMIDIEFTKLHLDNFADNLEFHKKESKKWKMLFSLSSYYDAEIKFGDGKMEFFVNSDDLKNRNFGNVYCHIYN